MPGKIFPNASNYLRPRFQKPILFTEFGYRSVDFAAGNQWELNGKAMNLELQQTAYRAFFNTMWKESYVADGFIWKWEFDKNAGGVNNKKYTPQGKPALNTISETYGFQ